MRKALILLPLVLALVVFAPARAQADSIPAVGDLITLTYGSSHVGSGGEFRVIGPGSAYDFETFCVETGEYFTPGNQYYIGGISGVTVNGGLTLTNPVAYLYAQFRVNPGAIGYSDPYAGDLQNAIWRLMAGNTSPLGDPNDFVGQAVAAVAGGWANNGLVAVLNLYGSYSAASGYGNPAQDQLTLTRAVPDGGATLMLLGGALMGLGALRRKSGA